MPRTLQLPEHAGLPPGIDESRVMRIDQLPEAIHLLAPTKGGTELWVRTLAAPRWHDQRWQLLSLPEALHGRPCICGDHLVAPCADGQLYRLPLGGQAPAANEVSFTWSSTKPPGPAEGGVYALGEDRVLLVDNGLRLRRLVLDNDRSIIRWKEEGRQFHLPSPIRGQPLMLEGNTFVFDSSGTLNQLNATLARQSHWTYDLNVTEGPVLRCEILIAVVMATESLLLISTPPAIRRSRSG